VIYNSVYVHHHHHYHHHHHHQKRQSQLWNLQLGA
jgi:hypothetical protein